MQYNYPHDQLDEQKNLPIPVPLFSSRQLFEQVRASAANLRNGDLRRGDAYRWRVRGIVSMTSTVFRGCRRLVAFATLSTSLAFGGTANAETPDEAEPEMDAGVDAEKPAAPPKPVATPATPPVSEPTAQAPAPFFEHMGPETFPGRLRGIYGGSLWLEPDFQGMQWPQNTRTGLGISANFWVDSGYEAIERGTNLLLNSKMWFQQGRALLRMTPAYVSDRFFAQAQVELVGNLCQSTSLVCLNTGTFATDDLFIRFGAWNAWDVKVGRFEGWEVYHLGMGMEPYTLERLGAGMFGVDTLTFPKLEAPSFYGVNYLHDRPSDGLAVGYAALHLYPTEYLRFELLAKLGSDNYRVDNSTGDTPWTYIGGRPTIIFDVGWFKLRMGGEYQQRTATTQTIDPGMMGQKKDPVPKRVQKGVGASVQFVIDPIIEFGVNAAIGSQDDTDAFARPVLENTYTTKSIGGFANVRLTERSLFGAGVNWTAQTDSYLAAGSTLNDFTSHLQCFGALQYRPLGQLYIKLVGGLARADFLPSDVAVAEWQNYMYSGRIRLLYIY